MSELTLNINDDLEKVAFKIFADYGLSPVQAFNIFLKKVAELKTIPFDYELKPNERTLRAIEEAKNGLCETIEVSSVEEFMEKMEKIANE